MPIPGVSAGPTRLGRYELLARLATGGMGEIFLARLEGAAGFEKLYVVKRILPHLADDARFREMLIAEARIAAKMAHANICQVYELGETHGQLYIVMEYLEGVSVLPLLRRSSKANTPLEFGLIAGVIQQTCDGLNYAHELRDRDGSYLGIVHRDVTPSNIYLTESGVAKLLDFGIAKAKGASTQTQEGTVKGKYAYMAPEQLRGASIDRRVDLFALGVVLYEMLALRRLFQRNTDYLTFRAVMEQPIPDVRRYRPDISDGLANVLMRALERDPNNRFETARQLGTAVLDAMSPARPWSQAEISDFVKHEFAAEMYKRQQSVQSVIGRSGVGRSTMPMLAHSSEANEGDGDDEGFPSVETEVDSAPKFVPQPAHARAGQSIDFAVGGTPPPFGGETNPGPPTLVPLQGVPLHVPTQGTQVVVVKQRGLLWPLLAVAMLAVAGGALFLVWQQTQKQQPAVVNITSTPDNSVSSGSLVVMRTNDAAVEAVADPPPVTADAGITKVVPPQLPKHRHPTDYNVAISENKAALNTCLSEHHEGAPRGQFKAVITVMPSGRAQDVGFEPEAVAATPLAACIRNVLIAGDYPVAAAKLQFKVPLTVP